MNRMEMKNYGYVYASDSKYLLQRGLQRLQMNHSTARIVVILSQSPATDLTDLLKFVWEQYNMLNIIAILLNIFKSTSKSVSELEKQINNHYSSHRLDAIIYNPFVPSGSRKGRFYIFSGNNHNSKSASENILTLSEQRTFNVYQYPLRIGMFNFYGLADPVKDNNQSVIGYNLPDGQMINTVIEAVNFKPIYIEPPNNSMYGGVTENGTFTGVLGLLEYGKVDVTFNIRVLKQYGQQHATFLPAVADTALSFVAPVVTDTSIPTFFEILDRSLMISTCIIFIVIASLDYYLQRIRSRMRSLRMSNDIGDNIISMFAIMLMVSITKPKIIHKRILYASLAIFSTVIAYGYQGNMVMLLTVKQEIYNLDTLQELADSNLKILVPIGLRNFLPNVSVADVDPVYHELSKRRKLISNYEDSYKQVAYKRDSVLFSLGIFSENYRYTLYSNETGDTLIHVMKEAPAKTILAYMVLKESPFRDRINAVVLRLFEGGIYRKFLEENWYKLSLQLNKIPPAEENELFSMQELSTIFMLFLMSCSICFLVFLGELFLINITMPQNKLKNNFQDSK